ncbi:hypothetical protein AGMMS49992_28370 [Clostridia bacterium]|nr:hypothetical protein AGMMS49992_28370 [Clostridia bacterium]
MNNGVDAEKFRFSPSVRETKRIELGISQDELVFGHVGRFDGNKNQVFLIRIFAEILKQNAKARLILIGSGYGANTEMLNEAQRYARETLPHDRYAFLGMRADVSKLLQAMDVFVFPSLLEGLPVACIEAQAAGLPCLISDTVARETGITDLAQFIPLQGSPKAWAETALAAANLTRRDMAETIKAVGYDAAQNASWLQAYYLSKYAERATE